MDSLIWLYVFGGIGVAYGLWRYHSEEIEARDFRISVLRGMLFKEMRERRELEERIDQ